VVHKGGHATKAGLSKSPVLLSFQRGRNRWVRVPPSPPADRDVRITQQNRAFLEPPDSDGGEPRWRPAGRPSCHHCGSGGRSNPWKTGQILDGRILESGFSDPTPWRMSACQRRPPAKAGRDRLEPGAPEIEDRTVILLRGPLRNKSGSDALRRAISKCLPQTANLESGGQSLNLSSGAPLIDDLGTLCGRCYECQSNECTCRPSRTS
jgi:hypothetical protein